MATGHAIPTAQTIRVYVKAPPQLLLLYPFIYNFLGRIYLTPGVFDQPRTLPPLEIPFTFNHNNDIKITGRTYIYTYTTYTYTYAGAHTITIIRTHNNNNNI